MGVVIMKRIGTAGLVIAAFACFGAAQEYHNNRDPRYQDPRWRSQVFLMIRSDLDRVQAQRASDKERTRLATTKQELTDLQTKLNRGVWDNGHVNDVIDSLEKSANDDRLSQRDRAMLADDRNRLKDFHNEHNRGNH
jgi:hypothetical protein